jgi:hypothetical protein
MNSTIPFSEDIFRDINSDIDAEKSPMEAPKKEAPVKIDTVGLISGALSNKLNLELTICRSLPKMDVRFEDTMKCVKNNSMPKF